MNSEKFSKPPIINRLRIVSGLQLSQRARRPAVLLPLVVAGLFFAGVASAKGIPGRVVINGPDLLTEVHVTDLETLAVLGQARLEDVKSQVAPPPEVAIAYLLSRYSDSEDSSQPWDQVLYVPDPQGGRGYVYILGLNNGSSGFDGRWYLAHPESERQLQQVLRSHRARMVPPPHPENPAQSRSKPPQMASTLGGMAILGGLLGLGAWWARRRTRVT